jgi:hypothetical protein
LPSGQCSEKRDGRLFLDNLRASIISSSQLATTIKIIYLCLVGGEIRGECKWALMQELALARGPR